jgi:hypothetical protein
MLAQPAIVIHTISFSIDQVPLIFKQQIINDMMYKLVAVIMSRAQMSRLLAAKMVVGKLVKQ